MKYGFAKILRPQESGYSGDKNKQRGKYIYLPKTCWEFFPLLKKDIFNHQSTIKCLLPNKSLIGLNMVYHNSKHHPEIRKNDKKGRDEIRIYIKDIHELLNLDSGDLMIFIRDLSQKDGFYTVNSFKNKDNDFEKLKVFDKKIFEISDDKNSFDIPLNFQEVNTFKENDLVENFNSIVEEMLKRRSNIPIIKPNKKVSRDVTVRGPQQPQVEDPAMALLCQITTQNSFKKVLRDIYSYKCCVRGRSLILNDPTGLEAAHIQPHSEGGPLLPTNGLLMSSDLHVLFEKGGFTLTYEGLIEVHPSIPKNSEIWKYHNLLVQPDKWQEFKPFSPYIKYHRENKFQKFKL